MTRPRPLMPLLSLSCPAAARCSSWSAHPPRNTEIRRGARHLPAQRDPEPVAPRGIDGRHHAAGQPLLQQPRVLRSRQEVESGDTIIPELAEKWSWQDNYRNLVFFLRHDVKWHDGKPFTSQDVKYTFDMRARRARRQGQAQGQPAQALVRRTSRPSRRPTPTRWSSGSSTRSPRCCSCSPRATRRSTPPTCRWPSSRTVASAPGRSSSRTTSRASWSST